MTLYEALRSLDTKLTGHKYDRTNLVETPAFLPQMRNGSLFYLSDGGYSRVYVHFDGKLHLTYNSTGQVFEAWEGARAEREAVEALLGTRYDTFEHDDGRRMVAINNVLPEGENPRELPSSWILVKTEWK